MVGVTHDGVRPEGLGRRRPSGEAPALPRDLSASTRLYGVLVGATVVLWGALLTPIATRVLTAGDAVVLRAVATIRNPIAGGVSDALLLALGSPWTIRLIGWPTLIAVLVMRRFHRLVVLFGVTLVVFAADSAANGLVGRMRPTEVEVIAPWVGYSHPSMSVALLGLAAIGSLYTLVPAGPSRNRAAWFAVGAVGLLGAARIYTAVDHPSDVLVGAITGMAVPAIAFRLLTPDDAMPVDYRRGRRAHLDVGGRRGEAIRTALLRQMGLPLVSVEPFALAGSAGSTPVRLTILGEDGAERLLFGKLYADVHLRSDRWYKLARTVMYGRLEDERSFNTVRRLVEYEDHMLRIARDVGLPTAEPYGFVEITPEREYLLVAEFLEGAAPIVADVVDEALIDDALGVVHRMWSAGLAHRDIKPGNLLVRNGRILLIDLAFAEVRPSPWRQAVDLANMMVTLALFASPEVVYERASRIFTPKEIAEAFAASRGATVPAQLRALVKKDGRHLVRAFRDLAPPRPPVSIQRWTIRRVAVTLAVVVAALAVAALSGYYLSAGGLL